MVILRLILAIFILAPQVHAASSGRSEFLANLGQGISKKADARYESRWTIADWFETKRQSRLQDMWLAGHKEDDLYEFYVGGRTGVRTTTIDGVENSVRTRANQGGAAAYATLAGLEGNYFEMNGGSDASPTLNAFGWDGFFGLRLVGDSLQNSNLTVLYGVQFRDEYGGENVQNQTAKARMTVYLTKALGLDGQYQWVFKAKSNQSNEIDGSAIDAQVFLDFSLLRVYGAWTKETRYRLVPSTLVKSERTRESIDVGFKLFF